MRRVVRFAIYSQHMTRTYDICMRRANRYASTISTIKSHNNMIAEQKFDYFLVLDFEATCDSPKQIEPMEIIEFPVIKLNAINFECEQIFHEYVRPIKHQTLTSYCTDLTGIVQDMVQQSQTFDIVFAQFDAWLKSVALIDDNCRPLKRFTFVTCGEWDLQMMLIDQCQLLNLRIPMYLRTWINIKKSYAQMTGKWPKGMTTMMEELGIKPTGRLHSGIDDAKNLALIMKAMAQKQFVFKNTSSEW